MKAKALLLSCAVLALSALWPAAGSAAPAKDRAAKHVPDSYIVVFRGSVDDPEAKTEKLERGKGFKARFRYGRVLKGFAGKLSERQVTELRADPDVAFVSPDRPVQASAMEPLASGDSAPAGVRRMGAASVTSTRGASTADVAVIDTGIDLSQPDLNAVNGKNCVGDGPAQDDQGHGTHVAGSIAARNNGSGVVGVAPDTKVHAVKVLDSQGSGTDSQVICGIDWVTATRKDTDPSNDIEVANLSLGGAGFPVSSCATTSDPLHRAICASTTAGTTYAVAAGNDGWDFDRALTPNTPAAYPEVLTVSALSDSDGEGGATGGAPSCRTGEIDDRYASFSNYAATSAGQAHTIAGPGVCINSTKLGGGQTQKSGTSMASPHVAGAVALCLSDGGPCAGLSPPQVIDKVRAGAQRYSTAIPSFGFSGDPLRPAGGRYYGFLDWAGEDIDAPSVASISPADGATGVATTSAVTVSFSEPMDKASASAAFSLRRASDNAAVPGSFSWNANTMTFRPSAAIGQGTSYTARVRIGARDAAGNPLASEQASGFKTLGNSPSSVPAGSPSPSTASPSPSTPSTAPSTTTPFTAKLAPVLSMSSSVRRRQSLLSVLRRGLRVRMGCSVACRMSARALLPRRTARRLGLGSGRRAVRLGAFSRSVGQAASRLLTVRFGRRSRTRFRRLRSVRIVLESKAADGSGRIRSVKREVSLRR